MINVEPGFNYNLISSCLKSSRTAAEKAPVKPLTVVKPRFTYSQVLQALSEGYVSPLNSDKKEKIMIVSFSGGRTSAYLCYLMKKMYGQRVHFVYMDTASEHPKTYDFIRNVNKAFNLNLTCLKTVFNHDGLGRLHLNTYEIVSVDDLRCDLSVFSEQMKKYGKSTASAAMCTRNMKQETFGRYVREKFGSLNNVDVWLGIRADEPKRLKPKDGIKYLADISDFDKEDILDFWKDQPFDLEIEEHLGNCVFCVKKSINKIALAQIDEPELADKWVIALDSASKRPDLTENNPKAIPSHVHGVIYRANNTFQSIRDKFKDYDRETVKNSIRSMKKKESGTCTESCEVFVCGTEDAA